MQLNQITKRAVALMLALALLLSLTACSASEAVNTIASIAGLSTEITPGKRLKNSTWINSDLENSIDETTELNLKDDFHTAVNRDWLLENKAEGDEVIDSFTYISECLAENQLRLLNPGTTFESDPNVMSQETLDHLLDLIWDMMDLAGNQEKRNELGVEPLRPYLDAIEQIDSLDELTEFIINTDGTNITGENFFDITVDMPHNTRDVYTVHIGSPSHTLLIAFDDYESLSFDSYLKYGYVKEAADYVLGALGYSPKQIKKLIKDCWSFEESISRIVPEPGEVQGGSYSSRGDKIYTLDDIRKIQGNFPLTDILESIAVAHSETFRVYEPGFLNYLGSYYKEKNLDKLKAYYTLHTVLDALPYLDDTCQAIDHKIQVAIASSQNKTVPSPSEPDPSDPEAVAEAKRTSLYNNYIHTLLSVPYQLAYIGSYCSSEAKQGILTMMEDIRTYFIDLLKTIEWMSPETRELAIYKMQKMEFRVMYPDVLPDYSGLVYKSYAEGGNLLDAVAAINKVSRAPAAHKVNQSVDRTEWDLKEMPTTIVNAGNQIHINSIVIFSGILAGGFMYDENAPIEQNYGRLGSSLGHEIIHSFDTVGYTLDAEGLPYGWWTNEDEVAFRQRSNKLVSYYSGLYIYPEYETTYNGQLVQTEAISDMGGMKCMLGLAEKIPDFDYDLFFRSYAENWRTQSSLTKEMEQASGDEHPLGFLRTNVTLQQFDKFFETYDIGPGDGMYLAPEDRVLVW